MLPSFFFYWVLEVSFSSNRIGFSGLYLVLPSVTGLF